jgi:hypothetical protein
MLYAIFCYDNEAVTCGWSKEKDAEVMANLGGVLDKLRTQGRLGPTARLMPTTTATTIRKGTAPVVMDGPCAETNEQLLGIYVVDCIDLDQAIETAKDLAKASGSAGAFELRPMMLFNPGGPLG